MVADYSNYESTGDFLVYNSLQIDSGVMGERTGTYGTVSDATSSDIGKFIVNFSDDTSTNKANFWVLDTDYNTYALVYTCYTDQTPDLWILSKAQTMDQSTIEGLNNFATSAGFDSSFMDN